MSIESEQTKRFEIRNPLFVTFQADDGSIVTHIYPPDGWSHKEYGLVLCDLVRHVAGSLGCDESDLWEWIDKERRNPTTTIERAQ